MDNSTYNVRLEQWTSLVQSCSDSGLTKAEWCRQNNIKIKTYYYWEKRFVTEATQQLSLPAPTQAGLLMRVNPETMPSDEMGTVGSGITIRHGESVITLPAGSSAEAVAELVKALNHHA